MWRVLLIAVLFYLIIWVVRGLVAPKRGPETSRLATEMVRDALTQIYFPKDRAISVSKNGQTYYFISADNRDAWLRRTGRQP
jgi:hypothetical protein